MNTDTQKYEIFKRTWWKKNANYPGGLEPHCGRKTHVKYVYGIEEARKVCAEINSTLEGRKLSLKAEFKSV